MKFLIIFTLILSVTFASPASSDGLNQEIAPQFEALRDVRFLVFTRFNPTIGQQVLFGDMNSLRASNYDANRPTRFVIHGFQSDSTSDVNIVITAAYLRSYDVNVIVVDWGLGANTINYITARNRVGEVGALVGQFCDFLHENNVLDFSRLYLIGSSLGAHIAGVSGKNIRRGRANTVIGLDPAGPLFNVNDPTTRVAPGDAEYVECIQTDSRNFGIGAAICDVDFFPNGGSNQPGCLTTLCDHSRAFNLFAESLNSNQLWGRRCNDISEIAAGCHGEGAYMGGEPSNFRNNVRGIYWMPTGGTSPFGQGRF